MYSVEENYLTSLACTIPPYFGQHFISYEESQIRYPAMHNESVSSYVEKMLLLLTGTKKPQDTTDSFFGTGYGMPSMNAFPRRIALGARVPNSCKH